jgi:hypothetical protein
MKDAYCSFEIAKLLKEKGFCERCFMCYEQDGKVFEGFGNWNKVDIYIAAPTQQMACAWMRKKGFEIGVFYLFKAINSDVTVFDGYIPNVTQVIDGVYKDSWDMDVVKDYNDAVERALKYALENLI